MELDELDESEIFKKTKDIVSKILVENGQKRTIVNNIKLFQ